MKNDASGKMKKKECRRKKAYGRRKMTDAEGRMNDKE